VLAARATIEFLPGAVTCQSRADAMSYFSEVRSLMVIRRIGLALLVALTAACASNSTGSGASTLAAPDTAAVRSAIDAANGRFLDAFKKSDKAGLMANYADDAVLMMPNQAGWRGHDGIDRAFTEFLAQMMFTAGGVTLDDVMVSGDMAVETGTYHWTFTTKSGTAIKDKGKYLTVWKRQSDGAWKIVRDINNTDLPAAM
jgi:uncharacterized protein (TIGR02246 family)